MTAKVTDSSFLNYSPLKLNSKTVNAMNVDAEWLFKCTKENEIQIMGHGGRKRVIVGLQGTEQSKLHDFYNLSHASVKSYNDFHLIHSN